MKSVMKKAFVAMIMVLAVGLMTGTSAQAKSKKKNALKVSMVCTGGDLCYKSTRDYVNCKESTSYVTVKYKGKNITNKVKFKSSNKKVATVTKKSAKWCYNHSMPAESKGVGQIKIKHFERSWTLTVTYKGMKTKVKIKPHKHDWSEQQCLYTNEYQCYPGTHEPLPEYCLTELNCGICGAKRVLTHKEEFERNFNHGWDYYDPVDDIYYYFGYHK